MIKINQKNKGFTLIELVVVIALIAILAVTFSIKIKPIMDNSKVSRVLNYLGMIRSRVSYTAAESDGYPDLASNDRALLTQHDVHPTESFYYDGDSYDETDLVVDRRDNTGGWHYIRESGEVYANLPNGAYTGDDKKEIWDINASWFALEKLKTLGIVLDANGKYENSQDFKDFIADTHKQIKGSKNQKKSTTIETASEETAALNKEIKLRKSGFLGVEAVSGDYFIELNSSGLTSIYRDINVVPKTTIEWSMSHRGSNGEGTANVRIVSGSNESITVMKTEKNRWKKYNGSYKVPKGQTTLRIYIESVDTTKEATVGNFLDNFSIGVKLS